MKKPLNTKGLSCMIPGRKKRIAELLKKELGYIIQYEISEPGIGFVTVTEVFVANDLKSATVLVSIMGKDQKEKHKCIDYFNEVHGYIQNLLSKKVYLRYLPTLKFKIDNTLDYIEKIDKILHDEKEKMDHYDE